MDSMSMQSFSANVPFKQPVVITHYISMVIAFLGCYPLLLTQQIRRQKVYILSICLVFSSIGFISGYFIQTSTNATSLVSCTFAIVLLCLGSLQTLLFCYRSSFISDHCPTLHTLLTKCLHRIPKWFDLGLGWCIMIISFSYLTLAALVFTESCNVGPQSQCLMPVAMGTGFLLYGTLVFLHLLSIIKLPRPSTPEYYEGVIVTFWGLISLFLADTPILGTEWRAINLGLLWFTGGLFSISLSVQTWIPALRERNVINALIICLTGRAIVRGITQTDDVYITEVHTMLGYILIFGAIARLTQIVFRKSPADNLPHRMFQQNTDTTNTLDEDEEEEDLAKEPKCKHRFIFASITLVAGLLASLSSISGGLLFMGANIGWIRYMRFYIQEPSTYVNLTVAVAFLWSAYVFGFCTIYKNLKTKNAIHEYEYLQLENTTNYPEDEEQREWSAPITVQTHLPPSEFVMSCSPSDLTPSTIPQSTMTENDHTKPQPLESTITLEKTIRPSEYRAKRRSLMVQSPVPGLYGNSNNKRARSSSSFGVGGVLPDEIVQLSKVPTSTDRRSWISSGSSSSVGYYSPSIDSSAPNSPPLLENQRPHSSISYTLPQGDMYNPHQQHVRSNSANGTNFDEYVVPSTQHPFEDEIYSIIDDGERRRSVHKTESGKRKERRLLTHNHHLSDTNNSRHNNEVVISNSTGSTRGHNQRWSSSHQKKPSGSPHNHHHQAKK